MTKLTDNEKLRLSFLNKETEELKKEIKILAKSISKDVLTPEECRQKREEKTKKEKTLATYNKEKTLFTKKCVRRNIMQKAKTIIVISVDFLNEQNVENVVSYALNKFRSRAYNNPKIIILAKEHPAHITHEKVMAILRTKEFTKRRNINYVYISVEDKILKTA